MRTDPRDLESSLLAKIAAAFLSHTPSELIEAEGVSKDRTQIDSEEQ